MVCYFLGNLQSLEKKLEILTWESIKKILKSGISGKKTVDLRSRRMENGTLTPDSYRPHMRGTFHDRLTSICGDSVHCEKNLTLSKDDCAKIFKMLCLPSLSARTFWVTRGGGGGDRLLGLLVKKKKDFKKWHF